MNTTTTEDTMRLNSCKWLSKWDKNWNFRPAFKADKISVPNKHFCCRSKMYTAIRRSRQIIADVSNHVILLWKQQQCTNSISASWFLVSKWLGLKFKSKVLMSRKFNFFMNSLKFFITFRLITMTTRNSRSMFGLKFHA